MPSKKPKPKSKAKKKPYVDREKLSDAVSMVDPRSARFSTIEKERRRIYSERSRLTKKLKGATVKADIAAIRSRLRRGTYWLNIVKKRKNTFTPLKGFTEKVVLTESNNTLTDFIYKWEARDETDNLLDSNLFKVYIVDGERFTRRQAGSILAAVDDLETKCDLTGTYYMEFIYNYDTNTITINAGS
jgi:hypothetical protein